MNLVLQKGESVEQALARLICQVKQLPNEKTPKRVEVTIDSPIKGRPPIKTTMMKDCLPDAAQHLMDVIEPVLNEEHDLSYRLGYSKGYEVKADGSLTNEQAAQRYLPTEGRNAPATAKTQASIANLTARVKAVESPGVDDAILGVFADAMILKRNQGFLNGFWQGFSDCGRGAMPQFQTKTDVEELEY